MPGKKVQCSYCSKVMRSDNLKNHVKIHDKTVNVQPLVTAEQSLVITGSKRPMSPDIPTFNDDKICPIKIPVDAGSEKEPKNLKIQALLEEIVNDTPMVEALTTILPKKTLPIVSQKKVLSKLPQQVIAELFPLKESAPRKVVAELSPSSSARTKGDIMGYSDGESSEEESSDDADESSTESEDYWYNRYKAIKSKISSCYRVEGLRWRFKKLFCKFIHDKKHKNRNEIVFILDELLRQEAISQETYTQVNNLLAESLGGDGPEEMM